MRKKKVILFTNIITPYIIPLYNYINQKGNFNFDVVTLAEREKNREWKLNRERILFNYKILPGLNLFFYGKKREKSIHLNFGVFVFLLIHNPDIIIISGYDCLAYWQAFLYCKLFRKKCILWNGTTLLSAGSLKGVKGFLKRFIIKKSDRFIAYGTKAKEYLEYFGAKPGNIYISLDTVDVNYFQEKVTNFKYRPDVLEDKKKLSNTVILYVGQLIKRKGVIQVLEALKILNDLEISFLIVGSGPEEVNLKKFCNDNNIKNVFFEGFHQQEELPKFYALADIFILPSFEEVWGLVINEALASGLFVLCSKYAGAAYDLINDENGVIFDPYNIEEIVESIKKVKDNISFLRSKRDQISQWAVQNLSIERSGEAVISAINF